MFKQHNFHQGFALLYSILLAGAVLTVGVILMNIIVKQLVFSSISRESEVSYYYVANSVRECLKANLKRDGFVSRDRDTRDYFAKQSVVLRCFSQEGIALNSPEDLGGGVYLYQLTQPIDIGGTSRYVGIKVYVNITKLNNPTQDGNSNTIADRFNYLAIADGYSQDPNLGGLRLTKRSAVYSQ